MSDKELFALYFAGIVGWTLHPGYCRDNAKPMTVEECRALAKEMVEVTLKEYGE